MIYIYDMNFTLAAALQSVMSAVPDVKVECGNIFSAPRGPQGLTLVSPANSFGFMDGGIDMVYSSYFGWNLQKNVQAAISARPFGELLVGEAINVETGNPSLPYVIIAPTMRVPMRITDAIDIMLATRAAVYCARKNNLDSIAMPGMGTGAGAVAPVVAAKAMRTGIILGRENISFPVSWRDAYARHMTLEG